MLTIEGLKSLSPLGGYKAAKLWPTINPILSTWFLFVFCPKVKTHAALDTAGSANFPLAVYSDYIISHAP